LNSGSWTTTLPLESCPSPFFVLGYFSDMVSHLNRAGLRSRSSSLCLLSS
jgi:hypothetical protein